MQNKQLDTKEISKSLQSVAPKHCDNCGNKYSEQDFRVVKTSPANTVLHLKCKNCGNAYMLNIMSPVNGMIGAQRTPLNIDLTHGEELEKFAGKVAVDRNEALDIHSFLDSKVTQKELAQLLGVD